MSPGPAGRLGARLPSWVRSCRTVADFPPRYMQQSSRRSSRGGIVRCITAQPKQGGGPSSLSCHFSATVYYAWDLPGCLEYLDRYVPSVVGRAGSQSGCQECAPARPAIHDKGISGPCQCYDNRTLCSVIPWHVPSREGNQQPPRSTASCQCHCQCRCRCRCRCMCMCKCPSVSVLGSA